MEFSELCIGIRRCGKDDGLALVLDEERPVVEHDVHRHKIVVETFWVDMAQLLEREEGLHLHDGHDTLQNAFQPQCGKHVVVDDGDKRLSMLVHDLRLMVRMKLTVQ